MDRIVLCKICGENLGIERPNWAQKHLQEYPTHRSFTDLLVENYRGNK